MQRTIYIRDELALEAHPEGHYILLRREGESGAVRVYGNQVRNLVAVLCSMSGGYSGIHSG